MKLTFLGATHEVTGSCFYLEACGSRILIDCGMEQGQDIFENQDIPVKPSDIDMVLLTHAHIDHSGKIPLLTKNGFTGQIFATEGTTLLCDIMLRDSAHIQETEAEWKNRKAQRAGRELTEPMYTVEDAENALKCFVGIPYDTEKYIAEGISIRFIDAGHLLGSASIQVKIQENGVSKTLVFSGDIGNKDQPIINDPQYPGEADYVIMESTYGDRTHERPTAYTTALAQLLQTTFDKGGNVVIPSFAVGRTQEMLYFIRQIKQEKLVHGHDGFEVYVDSPLAVEATSVFMKRMYSDFDGEARELLEQGINPISFEGLRTSVTSEESKAINDDKRPKVILSASGMCEAGRIRHHLKHNLWRPESTILFVGYQAEGTLGRKLIEGAESVKLFGEEIEVKAHICQLPGVSGHADCEGLMRWAASFEKKPQKIFVVHGEDEVCMHFAARLKEELGVDSYAPYSGTVFDLAEGVLVHEAEPVPVAKAETAVFAPERAKKEESADGAAAAPRRSEGGRRGDDLFAALLAAGEHLLEVIRRNRGGANKDLKKFAAQIEALCRKWDR